MQFFNSQTERPKAVCSHGESFADIILTMVFYGTANVSIRIL